VDTLGLLLGVVIHPANVQDRDGARILFTRLNTGMFKRLEKIFADAAYAGKFIDWVREMTGMIVEIVKRSDKMPIFIVQPKRWIVERTFGWLNRYRRLSKDYEQNPRTGEAFITIAMINLMLHRLKPG
jgi:putative transposase